METKSVTYKNIFNKQEKTEKKDNVKVFTNENGMIVEYIGGNNKCYDYVIDGLLITTRCGYSEKLLNLLSEYKVQPADYETQFKINAMLKAS